MNKRLSLIVRIVSAAIATHIASTTAFAWGLEISSQGSMADFVDMTGQSDFIGRWSYASEDATAVIEVDRCGDDLCVRRVMQSEVCSAPIMVVREDKSVPRKILNEGYTWRSSGKMNWIDGVQYDMQVDVSDQKYHSDGKPPNKIDQELVFDGGPSSVQRDAWSGGRAYPVQFLMHYKGVPTCAALS